MLCMATTWYQGDVIPPSIYVLCFGASFVCLWIQFLLNVFQNTLDYYNCRLGLDYIMPLCLLLSPSLTYSIDQTGFKLTAMLLSMPLSARVKGIYHHYLAGRSLLNQHPKHLWKCSNVSVISRFSFSGYF